MPSQSSASVAMRLQLIGARWFAFSGGVPCMSLRSVMNARSRTCFVSRQIARAVPSPTSPSSSPIITINFNAAGNFPQSSIGMILKPPFFPCPGSTIIAAFATGSFSEAASTA